MKGRKMKKAEFIAKYGEAAWENKLEQERAYYKAHCEEQKVRVRAWQENNPDKLQAHRRKNAHERGRKGGKYYEETLKYTRTGLHGERHRIRSKHGKDYRPFKMIIAPNSEIHHEWIKKTAEYRGVALVEKDPHQYGIIDVIQILDGKITLLTEEAVRKGLEKKGEKTKMTSKTESKGRYLQLHYYVSDADEALILQAGIEVGRFLDICVEDAVMRAKQNLGAE